MRVLYFAYEGFDTQNGTNHLAIKLIDYLLKEGFEVDLLSSHTKGMYEDVPAILRNRSGFKYDIVKRKNVAKQNFIQRYLAGIKYAYDCKKIWYKKRKQLDAIILQSTQTAFFSSRLLKKHFKGLVVFNSYDVFPNVAYETGAIKNKFIYNFLLFLQKKVYKNSNKIIVISKDMENTLIKDGVPANKIFEIRNWFDDSNIHKVESNCNKFIAKYGIDTSKFYVQYAGNFGITFNYKFVIELAKKLEPYPNIVLQMIGSGTNEERFKEEASLLSNIVFYPWQPLDIISDVYSECTIQLIPLSKGVIHNSFPSKGSLLMACGKVIICATETDSFYFKMINGSNAGICVTNDNSDEAANRIIDLYKNPEKIKELEKKAIDFGYKNYSSSVCLPKFKDVLHN